MHDLAIIGAGPAGLAAAIAAADNGLDVVIVDEQQRAGGQIFRQPPSEFSEPRRPFAAGYPWARQLIEDAESHPGIHWITGATAFGVLRDETAEPLSVAVSVAGTSRQLPARRVLVATGAYDLPVAFPGWTLPGVMMAGAVQGFIKSQRFLVAERLVLAGSHPLLLVVADQLLAAGADVAEVAFARGLPTVSEAWGSLGAVPGHLGLLAESAAAVVRLKRAGVRISTKTIVTSAASSGSGAGIDRVSAVELAPVDRDWRVIGPSRRVETEALVLGYGFQPSTELARQLGCKLDWSSPKGGWVVRHDDRMATTSRGIYVAGEPTGVAGAEQSRAEGTLAGLCIAADLKPSSIDNKKMDAAVTSIRSTRRFSRVVERIFMPNRRGLTALADAGTTVCRCELVTRGDIDSVLEQNAFIDTVSATKLECRSGMGPCQGRYCEMTVAGLVSEQRSRPIDQVGRFSAHVPVKPVPLSAYAALALTDGGDAAGCEQCSAAESES
ncbi:FAD-dependent oxidoreductase [Salinibacterium sp. M195]|uniref:FAD-dependent oxidoreductase n=1 Tax=Salinibacterium sp. M195 TaxID=2583374 RepID=UPI001C62A813|nr:FAD-dependent oxidoreductase [Salinibacterium sp. M195]QYH35565.1 FAD-dependent oxidoreductase [Salinibacterium sp. M195]